MSNQALRDKLFHALRGNALPGLKELDELVLVDIDKIMPIIEAHWQQEQMAWAELLETEVELKTSCYPRQIPV